MQRRIQRFKFVHSHVDSVYFRELFASMKEELPCMPDVIVYPPISLCDRIFRGLNHAKLLVEYYGPGDALILCPFQKKFFTSHQSRRTKKERENIREELTFDEKFADQIRGKNIVLINDLITTGYTAHTLAKLLKNAGAKQVVGYFLTSEKI